jgi:hypothetical protein
VPPNNAVGFINSLENGGSLLLHVSDYNGGDHDLVFSLGAVSDIRSQIALVCRRPGAAAPAQTTSAETDVNPRTPKSKAQSRAAKPAGAPLQLH